MAIALDKELRKAWESGRFGNKQAMEGKNLWPDREVQEPSSQCAKSFFDIIRRRLENTENADLFLDEPFERAGEQRRLVGIARVDETFADPRVASAGWWWARTRIHLPAEWQGYAEADFVKIGPTQQGLLTSIFVARGATVAAGAPLFERDDTADRAALDQAAQLLGQAEAQLANLQAGGKQTKIEQAVANLAEARATLVRAEADLKRNEPPLRICAGSIQDIDQLRAGYRLAEATVHVLEAALAQLHALLGRDQEIAAQRAAVDAARAACCGREIACRISSPNSGRSRPSRWRPS